MMRGDSGIRYPVSGIRYWLLDTGYRLRTTKN
jgi:hypothetical protein